MIAELFLRFFGWFAKYAFDALLWLIPPVPSWMGQGFTALAKVWGYLHALDSWVPVTLAVTMAAAVVAAWIVATIVQGLRTFVSYLTFGGGAS